MDKIAKIRQEIERRIKELSEAETDYREEGCDSISALLISGISELQKILSFISALESEEPDKSLEEAANEFCKTIFHKPFSENPQEEQIIYDGDRYVGFIAGAKWQAEQFEKNRLAACEKQTKEEYDREMEFAASIIEKEHRQPTFTDAINYGIEWQKKQIPMPEDTVIFNKGIEEGKRLMMEGAVEYEVMDFSSSLETHPFVSIPLDNKKYRFGDTVRIIVLPKDD